VRRYPPETHQNGPAGSGPLTSRGLAATGALACVVVLKRGPALPLCISCRRPLPPESDDVSLSLDGPAMLAALRAEEPAGDGERELRDALVAALCRTCGRAL
jgi:hypothetical protein